MKKIAFLLLIAVSFAVQSHAQSATLMPLVAGDTITNTGTVSKVVTVTSGSSGIYLQAIIKLLSGTGAGTAQLMGSLDGINFTNIGSAYTITNTTTQNAVFSIVAPVPQYVKILFTGSGTESAQVRVYYRSPRYQAP